jgi:hypothetical protein
MGLRVLDDYRPGYALLAFDRPSDQPSLPISIRSVRENLYLGPEGAWQRAPHYFTAERAEGDARQTLYRVGPEIVNHLLEHDRIAVATADGSLQEEALWENAVPQMLGPSRHSIYRAPGNVVGQTRVINVRPPEPEVEQPPPEVPPVIEPVEPTPPPPPPPPEPTPVPVPSRPMWQKLLPLVLIVAAALAAASVPQVRCKLFSISCVVPEPVPTPAPVDDTLRQATACAAAKRATAPCEVRACFAEYLAKTPAGKVAASATAILDDAAAACREANDDAARKRQEAEEKAALNSALQCAIGVTNACVVKNCYSGYLAKYGSSGKFRDQAQAEIAAAELRCQKPAETPTPPPAGPTTVALADGTYDAATQRACGAPAEYGITVNIGSGTVAWEHELRGTRYTWSGTIDGQGNIRASVGNSNSFSATGHYSDSDRAVQMKYPQCGSEPVTISIIGRR